MRFLLLLLVCYLHATALLGENKEIRPKAVVRMVEEPCGVERLAVHTGFKMQVLGGGTPRAACQSDGLACPHPVALLAEVLRLVGVERFQSVGMADDDGVAVAIMGCAQGDMAREGGADGVKNLFSVDCDVRTIPSCGKWYLTEYTTAQRLVFRRNPNYWEKDGNGTSVPGIKPHKNEGYFVPFAKKLADTVETPVIVVGGLRSKDTMESNLNTTNIKLLSLSRPLLREPDLPNKFLNNESEVSKCVSCNACYNSFEHRCPIRQRELQK